MCPTGSALYQATKRSDLRSAFDALDIDQDGKISQDDLRTFYAGFSGATASDDDVIGSMISVADSNKDGYVEYEEFEKVLDCSTKRGMEMGRERDIHGGAAGVMEEAFRVMDKDGDGKVGHDDLKSYLSWAGFDASDDDVKAMIRLGGGDDNEGVTYGGLLKILAV